MGIPSLDSDLVARWFPSHCRTVQCHYALENRSSSLAHTNSRLDRLRCPRERILGHLANPTRGVWAQLTINVDWDIFLTAKALSGWTELFGKASYTSGGDGRTSNRSIWSKSVLRDSGQNLRFDSPGITPRMESEVAGLIECWSGIADWKPASQANLFATGRSIRCILCNLKIKAPENNDHRPRRIMHTRNRKICCEGEGYAWAGTTEYPLG